MSEYTLVGVDGNAFMIMGYVSGCMRKEGRSRMQIGEYRKKAMAGNYNHLIQVSMEMLDELNRG